MRSPKSPLTPFAPLTKIQEVAEEDPKLRGSDPSPSAAFKASQEDQELIQPSRNMLEASRDDPEKREELE